MSRAVSRASSRSSQIREIPINPYAPYIRPKPCPNSKANRDIRKRLHMYPAMAITVLYSTLQHKRLTALTPLSYCLDDKVENIHSSALMQAVSR